MPLLKLGDISRPEYCYRAQLEVRSVMAWPKDAEARRRYLATVMAWHLGELERMAKELPDPNQAQGWPDTIAAIRKLENWHYAERVFGRWFQEGGSFMTIASARGLAEYQTEMQERTPAWFAAGLILTLIWSMARHHADLPGGASVRKAVFILERAGLPIIPRNRNDLRQAWTTYKPVAHFCAALFYTFMECTVFVERMEPDGGPDRVAAEMERRLNDEFPGFLALAGAYQRFGLTYAPPRAKAQPILDKAEAWLLPEEEQWKPSLYVPAPLDGPLLEIARAYRAPIPLD